MCSADAYVITDIQLIYPRDMPPESVSVGQRLGALYVINEGEQPLDNSEYEWRLLGLGVVLQQGQTIKPPNDPQGYIPPVVIPGYAIGDVVQLTVQPVDIKGIRGLERTVQTGELQDLYPYIEQLAFLNRADQQLDFRVGQSLSASYQFYSKFGSEDRSKYQWSLISNGQVLKEGDTTRFTTGQGLVTDFIIPNAAIGDILQLTVFPIDSNSLEGSESSIETTEIFYQIPEIRNLRVEFIEFKNLIPSGENDILRASYQFIGTEGSTDKSTYRWRLYSTKETLEEGISVVDELRGLSFIPDLPIIPNYFGEVLELTVFPIDSNGVDGKEQSVLTDNINYIAPQVTDMLVLRMSPFDEKKILVAGRYQFVPGSNSIDESTFQWISGNTGKVLSQGQVYRFQGMGNAAIPNVIVDRLDTIILKVTPIDGKGDKGEPKTASIFID